MAKKEETAEVEATEETVSAPEAPAAPPQAPNPDGLTIQDLNTMLQIISVVQARGAIKAEEMMVVGGLYGKLHNFLEQTGALAAAEGKLPAAGEQE